MSNQLQITGGAKVRNLEGVLTGTSGVVSSLGINVPDGIPQLDGSGKILVSQLPNSVMEYKGTWNAATNTPTLADGTGNQGDVYLCDTAGTVNFGAGPITFAVGDQVIYSGTIWQKASGATGTVTSVAVSRSGDALSITGSPITTSGTINIGFAGNSGQYIDGSGNLTTFPSIITQAQNLVTEVYNNTGATLSKGTIVYINGGHGNLPTVAKAIATSDATSAQTYGVVRADITNNNNGYVTVFGNIDDIDTQTYAEGTQLYLSGTTAGAWTSTKPHAPIHLVYVGIVVRSHPTQGVVEIRIQNGYELEELHDVAITSVANTDGIFYNSSNDLWENKTIAEVLGYTPANDASVVHLAGTETITGQKTFTSLIYANNNIVLPIAGSSSITYLANIAGTGMTSSGANYVGFNTNNDFFFAKDNYHSCVFVSNNSAVNYYTLQDGSGTLAFTSDIPSLTNYVTLTGNQTITGIKTFSNEALFGNNITLTGGDLVIASGSYNSNLNSVTLSANRNIDFPDASGVVALTSDIPSLSGYVQGSGTTNYISKFTASGTIGDSLLFDNGTNIGINNTTPSYKFDVNGTGRYTGNLMVSSALGFAIGDITSYQRIQHNAGTFSFLTSANGNASINAGGATFSSNVGIGNPSPSYNLDVTGTGRFLTTSTVPLTAETTSGNSGLIIKTSSSSTNWLLGGQYNVGNGFEITPSTAAGGTTFSTPALVVKNTGNVGIGTSSPSGKFNISNGGAAGLEFDATGGSSSGGYIQAYNRSTNAFTPLDIYANIIAFQTGTGGSSTERMRITSGGFTKISNTGSYPFNGTTHEVSSNQSNWILQHSNTASVPYGIQIKYINASPNVTGDNQFIYCEDSSTSRFIVWSSGTAQNRTGVYGTISDISLKENIVDATSKLDDLLSLKVRNFNFIGEDLKQIGFIAQEMEEVFPNMVDTDKEGLKSVKTSVLIPMLVKAIQELNDKVSALENKS